MHQDKKFWAHVRTIGQVIGYTHRTGGVRVYTLDDLGTAMLRSGLGVNHLMDAGGVPSPYAITLMEYFSYRAEVLNKYVEPRLMDLERARQEFELLYKTLKPLRQPPLNKQKGAKRTIAFLTAIVNILIETNAAGKPCNYDPRTLTTITKGHEPLRTLSRRVDGCFPSCVNPIAIWEIKEYYHTTTFGSRIADGVYETLLDGLELEELRLTEKVEVEHLLIIDSYRTWWKDGKSYLCRIIDMLNMGYVDEVLFGYEVIERLPAIVKAWVAKAT